MTTRISSLSKEYVSVPVTADADPTGNTVSMAFTTSDEPSSFTTAAWDGAATELADGTFRANAHILVGPGSTIGTLDDGPHHVWVKVAAGSEIPVIDTGFIEVY